MLAPALLACFCAEAWVAQRVASVQVVRVSTTRLRMSDEMKRMGRLAKDKAGEAKDALSKSSDRAMAGANVETSALGGSLGGAVVGGMLLGPVGALFGATIGSQMAENRAIKAKALAELEERGLSLEMVRMAQELSEELEEARAGLADVEEAYDNQRARTLKIDEKAEALYDKARARLEKGDEAGAREILALRERERERLPAALAETNLARERKLVMIERVQQIESRVSELTLLMDKSVSAASSQRWADSGFGSDVDLPPIEDPLLRKFEDLEKGERK